MASTKSKNKLDMKRKGEKKISQKIKESTQKVKEFITSLISADMSKETIDKHQAMLTELDSIVAEDDAKDKELIECKEVIIKQVKTQGSRDDSHDNEPKEPRSLEEIAREVVGGK